VKLLFDQNISFRVVKGLATLFSEARQVKELGLENAADRHIWNYAKENQYSIVTFDADFYDLVTLFGHPPKVIWLRLGNTSTLNLIKTLEQYSDIIKSFLTDPNYEDIGCLEIDG
jgi:predicted nuclease of predicted toxin-antitoxin system